MAEQGIREDINPEAYDSLEEVKYRIKDFEGVRPESIGKILTGKQVVDSFTTEYFKANLKSISLLINSGLIEKVEERIEVIIDSIQPDSAFNGTKISVLIRGKILFGGTQANDLQKLFTKAINGDLVEKDKIIEDLKGMTIDNIPFDKIATSKFTDGVEKINKTFDKDKIKIESTEEFYKGIKRFTEEECNAKMIEKVNEWIKSNQIILTPGLVRSIESIELSSKSFKEFINSK